MPQDQPLTFSKWYMYVIKRGFKHNVNSTTAYKIYVENHYKRGQ